MTFLSYRTWVGARQLADGFSLYKTKCSHIYLKSDHLINVFFICARENVLFSDYNAI
jgi:hypothetical protein